MSIYEVQNRLSLAQSFPIFGPLIVSPVKAVISAIQFVAGIVFGSLKGIFEALSGSHYHHSEAREWLVMGRHGLKQLAYSVVNMLSLGIIGAMVERR